MKRPSGSTSGIITLVTDFGVADSYVAQMKGVMLGIGPELLLVDVTHDVPPQDILEGAFQLATIWNVFPPGTIHLAIVDPGVGGSRRPIAFSFGGHIFVGPDNGLGTLVLGSALPDQIVVLDRPGFHRAHVAATFHGRDIFAPVAARLGMGAHLADVGTQPEDKSLTRLSLPAVERRAGGATGPVVSVDRFGNLRTLIRPDDIPDEPGDVEVECGSLRIRGIACTFGDVSPGAGVAYFGSHGGLEIALNGGNASQQWGIERGHVVEVQPRR